jgi:hypothetical protein
MGWWYPVMHTVSARIYTRRQKNMKKILLRLSLGKEVLFPSESTLVCSFQVFHQADVGAIIITYIVFVYSPFR